MIKPADRPVAGRYARALFQASVAQNAVDAVSTELARWLAVGKAVPAWSAALEHPRVPGSVKVELVTGALGTLSPILKALLGLLIEKKRLDALPDIAARYEALVNESRGVSVAEVRSAVELSAEQLAEVKKALSRFGKNVNVLAKVDPALLGGLVVQVGDRLWDGSVVGQLARLKEKWLATAAN